MGRPIVSESTLPAISMRAQAIGDSAASQRLVRTIARKDFASSQVREVNAAGQCRFIRNEIAKRSGACAGPS